MNALASNGLVGVLTKYYKWSLAVTLAALVCGYLVNGIQGVFIVAILSVLETSLSFDNAVLNARKLKDMSEGAKRWFLTWGILIAVFGMRLVFPIAIVAVMAGLGPIEVMNLAINNPDQYSHHLESVHHDISAFGGAFLLMVFLKFMLDPEKDHHWLGWLEAPLAKIGKLESVQSLITVAVIIGTSFALEESLRMAFVVSGLAGWAIYVVVDGIGSALEEYDEKVTAEHEAEESAAAAAPGETRKAVVGATIKSSIAGLLYLEVLDASMSFDGVIGAFALSTNIFIIMLGLGVGAMFVRSMTVQLVDSGTLSTFRYLEHGAFWAIGALASIMFINVGFHIPEVITGLIGGVAIVAALISSIRHNRKEKALEGATAGGEVRTLE